MTISSKKTAPARKKASQADPIKKTVGISVGDAVKIAAQYYRSVTGDVENILVAEVEKEPKNWLITIGHRKLFGSAVISSLYGADLEYKVISVNIESGEVNSMKVKKI